jgi:multiple sugar transport system permease protein
MSTVAQQHIAAAVGHRVRRWRAGMIATYALLVVTSAVLLFPLFWMATTSLKTLQQAETFPPVWWPHPWMWKNYVDLFTTLPFGTFTQNSVIITAIDTLGTVLSSSIIAFAFARLRARGSSVLFIVLLSTLMLPGSVIQVPTFIIFKTLHWIDTFYPLTVPSFFGDAFSIFLLRQYYSTIPFDLDEAAVIDGAGWLTIYWRIILPLARPALATVAILTIVANWTDFFGPLIYLNSLDKMTLAVGLTFFHGQHTTNLVLEMAGAAYSTLPMLVLFFLAQRYFVAGITLTGLKG